MASHQIMLQLYFWRGSWLAWIEPWNVSWDMRYDLFDPVFSLWMPVFPPPLHLSVVLRAVLLTLVPGGIQIFTVGLLRAYNAQK